jgi:S-adenosylmethionine synthetase
LSIASFLTRRRIWRIRWWAQHIYTVVDGVAEVYVWLCSQIGQPVDRPWITAVQVILAPGASLADVHAPITDIMHTELATLPRFIEQWTRGVWPVW